VTPERPEDLIDVPPALARMRRFPLDGALLLFDRDSGLTALCDGAETAHLRLRAPRVLQFSLTNACNLACHFCSRDTGAPSAFTAESAFALLRDLDRAGTLEVAFGGGEPLVFKGFSDLVRRLHDHTRLAVHVTTNGTRLTGDVAAALAPCAGEVRLSAYDDVDLRPMIDLLRKHHVSFGINWLVFPDRLPRLETFLFDLLELGCRDVLLLAYKGTDPGLHLSAAETADLATRVRALGLGLAGRMTLKLDVCWGDRMRAVPRLFDGGPCPAGRDFLVITSDKRVAPCSFHHLSLPFETAADVLRLWSEERDKLASAAAAPGCARLSDYGLAAARRSLPMTGATL
jgi:hypothetical protein